jgi:hypothetical protein
MHPNLLLVKGGIMMQVTNVPFDRKLYRGLGGMILPDQVDHPILVFTSSLSWPQHHPAYLSTA